MTSLIKYAVALLVTLNLGQLTAQNFSAKLFDKKTNTPIPFATVHYCPNRGVVTNAVGVF